MCPCVCVCAHLVTGLLSAFCFTRARQSRQQQRQQLPTQRPDTHTRTHVRTHTLSSFLSSSLNCAVICFRMRALAPGSWYFGVRYFQPGSHQRSPAFHLALSFPCEGKGRGKFRLFSAVLFYSPLTMLRGSRYSASQGGDQGASDSLLTDEPGPRAPACFSLRVVLCCFCQQGAERPSSFFLADSNRMPSVDPSPSVASSLTQVTEKGL